MGDKVSPFSLNVCCFLWGDGQIWLINIPKCKKCEKIFFQLRDNLSPLAFKTFCHDKPIGASPLTKGHFSHYLFRLRRILRGMEGGGLKKGGNAPRATKSEWQKSSISRKSIQHHLLHHTPYCFLSWQGTISRVSTIQYTHAMSHAVMLYIHTLLRNSLLLK